MESVLTETCGIDSTREDESTGALSRGMVDRLIETDVEVVFGRSSSSVSLNFSNLSLSGRPQKIIEFDDRFSN